MQVTAPPKLHPTTRYAKAVADGEIVAGEMVRLACARHLRDLGRQGTEDFPYWFSEAAANRRFDFFEFKLCHYEGDLDGQPFDLLGWQMFVIGSLAGWIDADGNRRFRTAYTETGKGSGKTPLGAGMALAGLVDDDEPGAQVYCAATTREQAGLGFKDAKAMARKSPELSGMLHITEHAITFENSYFQTVSSEAGNLHGKRPHVALIDEVHVHPDDSVIEALRAGTKGRRQALMFMITNSGMDRRSLAWRYREYSYRVVSGTVTDEQWFAYVCQLDVCAVHKAEGKDMPVDNCEGCDQWTDESVWLKANPSLPVVPGYRYLREQVNEAVGMPAKQDIVKRLNFCIWCLAYGTLVTMADGSRRKVEELRAGDKVLAFDEETGAFRHATVKVARDNGTQKVRQVLTKRGRKITVTENHQFWTRRGDRRFPKDGWVRADELVPGDRVGVAIGKPPLPRGSLRISRREAQYLGIMVGDGSCQRTPRLTASNAGVVDFVREFVESMGDELRPLPDGVHFDTRCEPRGKRTAARKLLERHGLWGKIDSTKRVPRRVMTGGPEAWAGFLSGYLDSDGWVNPTGFAWVSCNRPLLEDCQHLLAMLGVQAAIWDALEKTHFRLVVNDTIGRERLAAVLSPSHSRKAEKMKAFGTFREKRFSAYNFDTVASVAALPAQPTFGVEVEPFHTHITNGLITHNTTGKVAWIRPELWKAQDAIKDFEGRTGYAGYDFAAVNDLTAAMYIFPDEDGDGIDILPLIFLPEERVESVAARTNAPFHEWVRQGLIITTPGQTMNYNFVKERDREIRERYEIDSSGIDPWQSIQFRADLEADGITIEKVPQTNQRLHAVVEEAERLLSLHGFRHGGHPVLEWCASNVVLNIDGRGMKRLSKDASPEKIDPIAAVINALSVAMENKTEGDASFEEW